MLLALAKAGLIFVMCQLAFVAIVTMLFSAGVRNQAPSDRLLKQRRDATISSPDPTVLERGGARASRYARYYLIKPEARGSARLISGMQIISTSPAARASKYGT